MYVIFDYWFMITKCLDADNIRKNTISRAKYPNLEPIPDRKLRLEAYEVIYFKKFKYQN